MMTYLQSSCLKPDALKTCSRLPVLKQVTASRRGDTCKLFSYHITNWKVKPTMAQAWHAGNSLLFILEMSRQSQRLTELSLNSHPLVPLVGRGRQRQPAEGLSPFLQLLLLSGSTASDNNFLTTHRVLAQQQMLHSD